MNTPNFYTGTSGLLLPVPNKEFYPEEFKSRSRLCYYGSLFNSIEINSSFYKIPMVSTVAKWAADTPDDFKFTFKLWREITHCKGLDFQAEHIHHFFERIAAAGDKKGSLLVQFPGSIKPVHMRELKQLLMQVRQADSQKTWKVAVEFRHQSWYQTDTYDMLDALDIGLVLHDSSLKELLSLTLQMILSTSDFMGRVAITAAVTKTSFYMNMPLMLETGWRMERWCTCISIIPWAVQSRTWKHYGTMWFPQQLFVLFVNKGN